MKKLLFVLAGLFLLQINYAQETVNTNKFRQLGQELPTPNTYRTASGAPGKDYFQQKVDYDIKMQLDDDKMQLKGQEVITYHNKSGDELSYLWIQLDQNVRAQDSHSYSTSESTLSDKMSTRQLERLNPTFEGGFNIEKVVDQSGRPLKYTINKTMMRVDLPKTLKPNGTFKFGIDWWYNINNTKEIGGRSGYEPFEEGNNVYCIAQFFPRLCVYNDVEGWQNKQFLGRGEFALEFGDYNVEITVPSDHLVAATGDLTNSTSVLSKKHQERLNKAKKEYVQPVIIQSLEEANKNMEERSSSTKTWKFSAKNVRDFAFATSRRFIWDAMGVKLDNGKTVMAQSMYIKEGDCLWSKYSTKAVAHTLKWFSHYTFDYPYPTAWSIDGNMGMEYPMICFNFGRCEDDGTYTQRIKYGHIGVIIHEVGHNYFPMIVNSDERQWTWMDEGLCTFVQYLTEQQWERNFPSRRGEAHKIVNYMGGDKSRISPIMTNSESIYQFGNNAYGKPATGLNILRETILGRELFDYAFKEYANRWKFKHPTPAEFFRTMEDASGVDLDYFWRGWFYTNDHTDQAIASVKYYQLDSKNPQVEKGLAREQRDNAPRGISTIRNEKEIKKTYADEDPTIVDFYTNYDPLDVDAIDQEEYEQFLASLSPEEKELMEQNNHFYQINVKNNGGLLMPVIFEFLFEDGTTEVHRIPAEIWRRNESSINKTFVTDKAIKEIRLDPFLETADVNTDDNYYPPRPPKASKFELYKQKYQNRFRGDGSENPMQRANRASKKSKDIKP